MREGDLGDLVVRVLGKGELSDGGSGEGDSGGGIVSGHGVRIGGSVNEGVIDGVCSLGGCRGGLKTFGAPPKVCDVRVGGVNGDAEVDCAVDLSRSCGEISNGKVRGAVSSRVPRGSLEGIAQGKDFSLSDDSGLPCTESKVLSTDCVHSYTIEAHGLRNVFGVSSVPFSKGEFRASGSNVAGRSLSSTSVFIGNIPPSLSSRDLKVWFSKFGNVVDSFIPFKRSKNNGSRFGFVRFSEEMDALQACAELDGSVCDGFKVIVNVSKFARSPANHEVNAGKCSGTGILLPDQVCPTKNSGISGCFSYAQVLQSGLSVSADNIAAGSFLNPAELEGNHPASKGIDEDVEYSEFFCNKPDIACFGSNLSESELRGPCQIISHCMIDVNLDPVAVEFCSRGVSGVGKEECGDKVRSWSLFMADCEYCNGKGFKGSGGSLRSEADGSTKFHLANVSSVGELAFPSSVFQPVLAPKGFHIINKANLEAVTNGLIDGVSEAFELGEAVGIDISYEAKDLIIAVMEKRQVFLKTLFDNG